MAVLILSRWGWLVVGRDKLLEEAVRDWVSKGGERWGCGEEGGYRWFVLFDPLDSNGVLVEGRNGEERRGGEVLYGMVPYGEV